MRSQTAQRKSTNQKQKGFSLIELLIVVAVILVIAAIAIPNFVRSRMRANEAGAVQSLRNITTANTVYAVTYGIGFADDLTKLGGDPAVPDQNAAGLIDSVLSGGFKTGYAFSYTPVVVGGRVVAYSVNADPTNVGVTGERYFFTDLSGVIRFSLSGAATATDTPI
jgi:prepilin-type N-terminal cleavage/methylation domain-containing protein